MSEAKARPLPSSFRSRLMARELLLGSFIKTPTSHTTEILGDIGFDFVVIDEEHAPFDRQATDVALLAARAYGTAGLVRVPSTSAAGILSVLDCGATGVLVPHVSTPEIARQIAAAARHRGGKRGYSTSPRAGRYGGVPMARHIETLDAETAVIAMIEDPEALDVIDEIVAVDGLDACFIGRGDLTVSLGAPKSDAPAVKAAVERIVKAMDKVGKPVMVMVASIAEAREFRELGVTAFIVSTDQGFLRRAAAQAAADFAALA